MIMKKQPRRLDLDQHVDENAVIKSKYEAETYISSYPYSGQRFASKVLSDSAVFGD